MKGRRGVKSRRGGRAQARNRHPGKGPNQSGGHTRESLGQTRGDAPHRVNGLHPKGAQMCANVRLLAKDGRAQGSESYRRGAKPPGGERHQRDASHQGGESHRRSAKRPGNAHSRGDARDPGAGPDLDGVPHLDGVQTMCREIKERSLTVVPHRGSAQDRGDVPHPRSNQDPGGGMVRGGGRHRSTTGDAKSSPLRRSVMPQGNVSRLNSGPRPESVRHTRN